MRHLVVFGAACLGVMVSLAARPVWEDPAKPGASSAVVALKDGSRLRVDALADCLFRVRRTAGGVWTESGMNRYGVLKADYAPCKAAREPAALKTSRAAVAWDDAGGLTFTGGSAPVAIRTALAGKGFSIRFGLAKDERIYGLGDADRSCVMRRGKKFDIWVKNVSSYIPVPMTLSRNGWGLLLNSTWRHSFDVGQADPDAMVCAAPEGEVDFYLFCGKDYRELLATYTELAGRPSLLPAWGYGLVFVNNQFIDAFSLVDDAMRFRERDFPCDVLGLEPGWMEKFYDNTTKKQWNKTRFYIPYWAPKSDYLFTRALSRKGFKLSLWLCCDYDLTRFEEQLHSGLVREEAGGRTVLPALAANGAWVDDRIGGTNAVALRAGENTDSAPEGTRPWFEHLKYFVDQGAACFKLDGCNQVGEHPGRAWANGRTDEEVHNLYPLIYDKQMARGFEAYTGRRSMVYSASGYAGVQQYVATWAGDTGGGASVVPSMLNLAFCGHSNHSCDMEVDSPAGIHFGFLQTWAQENNWDYWYQPWLLRDEVIPCFRFYDHLRYRLLPYLYTAAAGASRTGWPVMRAMAMDWPDDPSWDARTTQYMLGPDLLISAFARTVRLPAGEWYDFWTGDRLAGGREIPVKTDALHGGALLVRAGAVIPTAPDVSHVTAGWFAKPGLLVYPGAAASSSELYEDDGASLGYHSGKSARIRLGCEPVAGGLRVTVGAREGAFPGMPGARDFAVRVRLDAAPKSVLVDGRPAPDLVWDAAARQAAFTLPGCGEKPRAAQILY